MTTEWSNYYASLEQWVKEQHQALSVSEQRMRQAAEEQNRWWRASFLAQKQYEKEMQRFQLRASQNLADSQRHPAAQVDDRHIPVQFHRYVIPHPWRRVAAEIIDSLILLVIKIAIIYCLSGDTSSSTGFSRLFGFNIFPASEYRTLRRARIWAKSELRKSELFLTKLEQLLFGGDGEQDLSDADGDLFDLDLLLIVDHIGRFFGAIIEAIFISRCFFGRGPGGATVGKWIMNLRVVSCDEIIPLPEMVEVVPGSNLGIIRAIVRSMLKSTSFLTIFSFICMMLFRYHRCTYDIIAGSLVVQPLPIVVQTPDQNVGNDMRAAVQQNEHENQR
ncbi:hypothetical protein CRM22_007161 [Opisthorchis felineus]|uniref:Uncharacterized protein n=1 Tax=Opisthorchis felineus TaxID=147828 RepID=A0A4S2LPZ9_OPIFE|nr:hypothetical protein CRM22_007161 [Opisthorchis felineus]TGZ62968.1 hypothetical protein CRM22_007161 [Opisthorchis felineus]TGZ62969.1 hypothetical protein CRM22_007161 [Opisthorchis felineus]